MTSEDFEQFLKNQIACGEITPEDAESEYDFFVNGSDSWQNVYGW